MELLIALIFILLSTVLSIDYEPQKDVSLKATRNVDLTSQLVKVKIDYEIKNNGKNEINHFLHTMSNNEAAHLSWLIAFDGVKKAGAVKLLVDEVVVKGTLSEFTFYKVEFPNSLSAGASISIVVEYILTEMLTPSPSEITQSENQFLLYKGFANILSAYPIERESTHFKVGSIKPISFTEVNPSKYANDKILYGSYLNQKPYEQKPITIHYENNSPFVVATSVERVIEVSHWGNIAVEEHIELVHKGAKLKGSFSRLDFQMDRRGARQPVVKSFTSLWRGSDFRTHLPSESTDIYYRDQIGNISTSTLTTRADRLDIELRPRFPLFGGWKTNYVLGYNVPTSGHLLWDPATSSYALKIRLLDHLFQNAVVQKLRVKIILPETCKNIKLVTPYPIQRKLDEIHKTYLDIAGRPVVVIEKDNLVDNHIQPIVVYYKFERIYLLREPLIVIIAFFLLFISAIVMFRLDFAITVKEAGKETNINHQKKQ